MELLTWAGITLCLLQAGTFSGLNLAFFQVPRLRLEIEADGGDGHARKVLALRRDPHLLLATILWGNVAVNVLLTLLSNSVMFGVGAFLFSTVALTLLGEIVPQAWFSHHALAAAARLSPMIRFYRVLLYPVAKPSALLLDAWLGREGAHYYGERDLKDFIRRHIAGHAEIDALEATGAINFLTLDDIPVGGEGEPLDPGSVIRVPFRDGRPVFPPFAPSREDPFLARVNASGRRWAVLVDERDEPRLVLDAAALLRSVLMDGTADPGRFAHRPVLVTDPAFPLGRAIARLRVEPQREGDDVVDQDVILLWGPERRIVTGSDILGRLLRGIVRRG